MTDLNKRLITDLARLAARYRPEDWKHLVEALEDHRRRGQITNLLRELSAVSSTRRKTPSKGPRQPSLTGRVRSRLDEIRTKDEERADLLDDVWLKLRQRQLLPTMAMVRAFAEAAGVKGLSSTRRDKAVTELMDQLLDMPDEVLHRMTHLTASDDRQLGEEYERWVALILGEDHPKAN